MFFCDQEGTQSNFQGVRDVIAARGLFCSLYSDRGSHYWHTPEAGGKVDKSHLTQFGRALQPQDCASRRLYLSLTAIPDV